MKKTFILLSSGLLMFLTIFQGCKKDESIPLSEILLGKWEVQKEDHNLYLNDGLYRDSTSTYEDNQMVVEFLTGGTGKGYSFDEYEGDFTWSLNGNELTVSFFPDGPMKMNYNEGLKSIALTFTETWREDNIDWKYEMIITALKL